MNELLQTAMMEVFSQTFGLELQPCEAPPAEDGYTAEIPFSDGRESFSAAVWVQKPILRRLANLLLFEEDPDEETLRDLTSELANFIVGHAKMAASDKNLPYSIETPRFSGIKPLEQSDRTLLYEFENQCVALQIKGLNG
ncbi:hypothetical protein HCR_06260 [Hydrogenimonas cancrithermarum]|uniref:Chemotaxis phosphatase CheX-like domain-containing protein n=1 Tax=Hydrogenimonas cancrithermarum TaxID=2993563 RepID=A0ABM8FKV3_9BACT|nr:hypothetical protein HCR_06260 [Hydrogenimonas cancrithermarum]